jgi:hypothetical protein
MCVFYCFDKVRIQLKLLILYSQLPEDVVEIVADAMQDIVRCCLGSSVSRTSAIDSTDKVQGVTFGKCNPAHAHVLK